MINNKKVIAITLARGGSKGIKNKNLSIINGKDLIQRTIAIARQSKYIDSHFINSDSLQILELANKYGAKIYKRPDHLAEDSSSSADAILDFINSLTDKPDIIVELMCTCPFKRAIDVDRCIENLDLGNCDSSLTVTRILDHHPSRVKYIENGVLCDFYPEIKESRRQDLTPIAYVRAGGIYVFSYNSFIKYKSRYGGIINPHIIPDINSINIDEPLDLKMAQIIGEEHDL